MANINALQNTLKTGSKAISQVKGLIAFLLLSCVSLFASPLVSKENTATKTPGFTAAELQQLRGHYSTSYGYYYVTSKNNVGITRSEGKRIYLIKHSDGRIYPVYKLLGFIPLKPSDTAFTLEQRRGRLMVIMHSIEKGKAVAEEIGEKFAPVKIGADWLRRTGRYKVRLVNGKSNLKTLHLKTKNHVFLASMNNDPTDYPFLPYLKKIKAAHTNSLYIPGSDEGHLVELFTKQDKIMLRTKRALMQLERIK